MHWSIDRTSESCFHPLGLSAYLDFDVSSPVIRCLGPFGSSDLSEMEVRKASAVLTKQLEEQNSDRFVVWGSYTETPEFAEHQFPILGSLCGFHPNLSYRAELASQLNYLQMKREWCVVGSSGERIHFSGLVMDRIGESIDANSVPTKFLHPVTAESVVLKLVELETYRAGMQFKVEARIEHSSLMWNAICSPSIAVN